ncbi:hypothetical protein LJR225_004710 [Phenylobacterium sp. LjRoot225]|uniref:hypothetical protein n=1 Tax=Phenylobacterium sp. LjRoot225 TaxID=3342285 RepID=UPI003ECC4676
MSDVDEVSAEQQAALQPAGVYANQVFLNVIDGMIRISFGLKAGGHLNFNQAVTISPGLALALRELIDSYVQPPAKAERTKTQKPSRPGRVKEIRSYN